MITQELLNYIKEARGKAMDEEQIKSQLLQLGWSVEDINNAFVTINNNIPLPLTSSSSQVNGGRVPKENMGNMWDAFQHILMFISLYVFASSVALILHYYVDKFVPGIEISGYDSMIAYTGNTFLNIYLSALIVSFPIWAFLFLRITRQTIKTPKIRQLKSRKILTYITLIGTFIIMIANIISTVSSFLNGNISPNFLLHFSVTVGISTLVFVYYLNEVKEDRHYV
ncbi:MAG: DUF5671 domain-containing protein [bacterium]|nr:DUF5671 domain-containing protein [bacterium]